MWIRVNIILISDISLNERSNQGISCGTYLKFEREDSITKIENP